jgi:hypothetical protein
MYKKMKTPPQQGHPLMLIQKWFVGMTYQDRGCKHKVRFLLRRCFRIVARSRTFPPAHSMHGHGYLDNRMTSAWTSTSCHNCRCFKHWNSPSASLWSVRRVKLRYENTLQAERAHMYTITCLGGYTQKESHITCCCHMTVKPFQT